MTAWQKSQSDGTLWDDLQRLILDARMAFISLPKWEKPFHIFWLLGPFILLIERSPADAWLSILALSFAFRSLCRRELTWYIVYIFPNLHHTHTSGSASASAERRADSTQTDSVATIPAHPYKSQN